MGIYLACLGANVVLSDLPVLKEMIEKNVNLNRELLKGKAEFAVLNWKKNEHSKEKMN